MTREEWKEAYAKARLKARKGFRVAGPGEVAVCMAARDQDKADWRWREFRTALRRGLSRHAGPASTSPRVFAEPTMSA